MATLLALARGAGYPIDERRLARWHREGLLPTARQRGLGRGLGTESLYPAGTEKQLLALLAIRRTKRRLSAVAWDLWWQGFQVSEEHVRTILRTTAARVVKVSALMRDSRTGGLSAKAIELLDKGAHFPRPLAASARKLAPGHTEAIAEVLLEVLAGTYDGLPLAPGSSSAVAGSLEALLGLERARTDTVLDKGPWLTGSVDDIHDVLAQMARHMREVDWPRLADQAPWSDVVQARDQAQGFWTTISTFSEFAEVGFGKGAFGFGILREMMRQMMKDQTLQAFLLLWWIVVRHDPAVREGQDTYADLATTSVPAMKRAAVTVDVLAESFPGAAGILNREALARSLTSVAAHEAYMAKVLAFREANASALDRFFLDHPELRQQTNASESNPRTADADPAEH